MKHLGKLATYAFLIAVGCTMLAPFLWMCSSSLKPDDQVFRSNWIPTKDYVEAAGTRYEVERRYEAPGGAGRYRIAFTDAAGAEREAVVATDLLTPSRSGDDYLYTPEGELIGRGGLEPCDPVSADLHHVGRVCPQTGGDDNIRRTHRGPGRNVQIRSNPALEVRQIVGQGRRTKGHHGGQDDCSTHCLARPEVGLRDFRYPTDRYPRDVVGTRYAGRGPGLTRLFACGIDAEGGRRCRARPGSRVPECFSS